LWFSQWVSEKILSGAEASSVTLVTIKAILAPAFCGWVSDAVLEARKSDVTKKMIEKTWGEGGAGLGTSCTKCSIIGIVYHDECSLIDNNVVYDAFFELNSCCL